MTIYSKRQENPLIKNFHRSFLSSVDDYIKNNIDTLTGQEIGYLYYDLWHELKQQRGTSAGFTGYSEFLLFRCLFHTLGEENWQIKSLGGRFTDPKQFVSDNNVLSQGKYHKFGGRNLAPDICLETLTGEIKFIVEIKLNINGGSNQIDGIIRNLNTIRIKYPDVKAAVIVFNKDSYGPHRDSLLNGWWSHILLEEDKSPISEFYKHAMNLSISD